jgi:Dynein heavy chain AAA lid domain
VLQADAAAITIGRAFAFAFVWAFGGGLATTAAQESFDVFAREQLRSIIAFPGDQLHRFYRHDVF